MTASRNHDKLPVCPTLAPRFSFFQRVATRHEGSSEVGHEETKIEDRVDDAVFDLRSSLTYYDTSPLLSPRQTVTSISIIQTGRVSLYLQNQWFGGTRTSGAHIEKAISVLD